MDEFFKSLKEIYENFDREYLQNTDTKCVECELCCSSQFKYPPLTQLDCDYLEYFIKEHNITPPVENFKNFIINKDRDYCPYWIKGQGCSVYEARPMFCRTFGLFRFEGEQPLPENCTFSEKRIDVTSETRYKIIKYLPEYLELRYEYEVFKAGNNEEKVKALILLGGEYINQNRMSEALSTFLEAEKLEPGNVDVLYDLGFVYRGMNKFEPAREKLERCIALGGEEKQPCVYQHTGYVYLAMNSIEEALRAFTKAVEIEPKSVLSYLGLTIYYVMKDNKEKALEYCNKALEIEPGNNTGESLLKTVLEM